jgi:hypothetical protein
MRASYFGPAHHPNVGQFRCSIMGIRNPDVEITCCARPPLQHESPKLERITHKQLE